jgi:AraC-like DNA-binding protein
MQKKNNNFTEFNYKKPSKPLDDFVHTFWTHINFSEEAKNITILPDSFFKLIFIFQNGKLIAYFMTGLWLSEMEFKTPPNTQLYGIKFKILAPEYIFQTEIASILQSHKDLSSDFLSIEKLCFQNLNDFVEQIEPILLERLSRTKKRVKANKLQLSQLLYAVNGNIKVEEVSKQINWSISQINRYLNKYIGISLKSYLNIQKCYSSYFHIRDGEFYPSNEYFDQSHFIREIKKHTGKTPRELFKNQNARFIQLKNI